MELVIILGVILSVGVITFGVVMAIDLNKLIMAESFTGCKSYGNWTRFKTKGELE